MDRYYIAYSAIKALVDEKKIKPEVAVDALKKWNIDPQKQDPVKA